MEPRSIVTTRPVVITETIGSNTTYTVLSQNYIFDELSIGANYQGPRNDPVVNAQTFTKRLDTAYWGQYDLWSPGYHQTRSGVVRSFTHVGVPGSWGVAYDGPIFAYLYNECVSKFYDQVRGDVDWAVNVAEAKQTLSAIREYRDYLIPLADKLAVEGGRLVRFVRRFHPRQWAKRWLEYQYGWKPLVTDMYQTYHQMMDFATYHLVRVEAKKTYRTRHVVEWPDEEFNGSLEKVTYRSSYRMKVGGIARMEQDRLLALSGYTSLNPASLAWELVPFSFVADWVWNLGGYLRSLESSLLLTVLNGYKVEGYQIASDARYMGSLQSTYDNRQLTATAAAVRSYKNRQPSSLTPSYPVVHLEMGWQRLISAASLISSHLNGAGRR
jgi:hypothetical protein